MIFLLNETIPTLPLHLSIWSFSPVRGGNKDFYKQGRCTTKNRKCANLSSFIAFSELTF